MSARAIILVSLLVNLGLAAWAFHLHSRHTVVASPNEPTATVQETAQRSLLDRARTVVVTTEQDAPFSWSQIESADYKDYIARLRGVGCPEATIRDIIAADVNKLYLPRFRALLPTGQTREYWKVPPQYFSKTERDRQEKFRALEKEKSELLLTLLGVDPVKQKQKESGVVDYYDRMLSFLPEEKRSAVREVHLQYEMQMQKFYIGQYQDEEDRKQLKAIRDQRIAALSPLLAPDELRLYEISTSQVANQLRYDLDGFKPTQEEFEKIYDLRKKREDDLTVYGSDPVEQEKRRKALEEVNAQIKQTLGDERYAEYQRAQDYSYKSLVRVLQRQELSEDLAAQLYAAKQSYDDEAKKLRADTSLDAEQRKAAIKELGTKANDHFKQQLGDRAYQSYKQQGGYWLNNLSR